MAPAEEPKLQLDPEPKPRQKRLATRAKKLKLGATDDAKLRDSSDVSPPNSECASGAMSCSASNDDSDNDLRQRQGPVIDADVPDPVPLTPPMSPATPTDIPLLHASPLDSPQPESPPPETPQPPVPDLPISSTPSRRKLEQRATRAKKLKLSATDDVKHDVSSLNSECASETISCSASNDDSDSDARLKQRPGLVIEADVPSPVLPMPPVNPATPTDIPLLDASPEVVDSPPPELPRPETLQPPVPGLPTLRTPPGEKPLYSPTSPAPDEAEIQPEPTVPPTFCGPLTRKETWRIALFEQDSSSDADNEPTQPSDLATPCIPDLIQFPSSLITGPLLAPEETVAAPPVETVPDDAMPADIDLGSNSYRLAKSTFHRVALLGRQWAVEKKLPTTLPGHSDIKLTWVKTWTWQPQPRYVITGRVKCPFHDNCTKTRTINDEFTQVCGNIQVVGYLGAWIEKAITKRYASKFDHMEKGENPSVEETLAFLRKERLLVQVPPPVSPPVAAPASPPVLPAASDAK